MYPEIGQGRTGASFPKKSRLLKRPEFLVLADRSVRPDLKIQAGHFLIVGRLNDLERTRLGITVTKKIGKAVVRNGLKRQVREFFRLNVSRWPIGLDLLFIARSQAGRASRRAVAGDLAEAGRRIANWQPKNQKLASFPVNQAGHSAPPQSLTRGYSDEADAVPVAPAKNTSEESAFRRAVQPFIDLAEFIQWALGRLALGLIFIYQRCISPMLPPSCRFRPTCSSYAASAIKIHGIWRGSRLAAIRLLKCHPLHPGGYDPVPSKK